jgi:hypothetical protein
MSQYSVFSGGGLEVQGIYPQFKWYQSDGAADQKNTVLLVDGGAWDVRLYDDTNTVYNVPFSIARSGATVSYIEFNSNNYIVFNTGTTYTSNERMRILQSGNVGIGTSGPTAKLHIYDTSNNAYMILDAGGSGNQYAAINAGTRTRDWTIKFHDGNFTSSYAMNVSYTGSDLVVPNIITARKDGNVGIGTISPTYKLHVNGDFAANSKSFVIDHPTKPGMKLRYGSLEGPENGVYVRGKSTSAVIELPDYWLGLVDANTITVQLTANYRPQNLFVISIYENKVYVGSDDLELDYFYFVQAERKDVDKIVVEF